jgi:hypothetical protein
MSVVMRILQQFDPVHEKEFMALERQFADLERSRPDFPKGKRLQPLSGGEPCNTLIWQCEFPDIQAAVKTLAFFDGDSAHEALLRQQILFFKQVKIEFSTTLDF